MAISDHWHRVAKYRATIVEVDPTNNIIDARMGDGAPRRIMVWEVPSGFRWPVVGEEWSVYEQNGSWYLGDRINDLLDDHPITNMQPGDQRLDGVRIFDSKGNRLLPVDVSNLRDGQVVVYNSDEDNMAAATADPLPQPGFLQLTAAATAPAGWLLCNGAAVSRLTYSTLFTTIGTTYGVGDGSTTFNVPDMQGRTPVGVGTATGAAGATAHTLGQKAGEETHLLTSAESGMPSHNHTQNPHAHAPISGARFLEWDSTTVTVPVGGAAAATPTASDTATQAQTATNIAASAVNASNNHNNMQPYLGLNYLIKT